MFSFLQMFSSVGRQHRSILPVNEKPFSGLMNRPDDIWPTNISVEHRVWVGMHNLLGMSEGVTSVRIDRMRTTSASRTHTIASTTSCANFGRAFKPLGWRYTIPHVGSSNLCKYRLSTFGTDLCARN